MRNWRNTLKRSNKKINKLKILVVLGPTATGKSSLAVQLAKKFNGEIISADSRQVYRDMNIGTGKITKNEMAGITHHLLDVVSPKGTFSVVKFKKFAGEAIHKIISRGKLPIICGGTGFYIQSVVNDLQIPEIPTNAKLRKTLETKSLDALNSELKKLDPLRAKKIDTQNRVRLVRAIELAQVLGKVPKLKYKKNKKYDFLQIGLTLDQKTLKEKIERRLLKRIRAGMIAEIKRLHDKGVSWKRLENFGLEYRFVAKYLQGKLAKQEMVQLLQTAIRQYAKRQITWFKRDKEIKWFDPKDKKNIEKEVENFVCNCSQE